MHHLGSFGVRHTVAQTTSIFIYEINIEDIILDYLKLSAILNSQTSSQNIELMETQTLEKDLNQNIYGMNSK